MCWMLSVSADASSNSVCKRVLMLAGSSALAHTVGLGTTYLGSTSSVGRFELTSNQDASSLALTLGATTALSYTNALARLFGFAVWSR